MQAIKQIFKNLQRVVVDESEKYFNFNRLVVFNFPIFSYKSFKLSIFGKFLLCSVSLLFDKFSQRSRCSGWNKCKSKSCIILLSRNSQTNKIVLVNKFFGSSLIWLCCKYLEQQQIKEIIKTCDELTMRNSLTIFSIP